MIHPQIIPCINVSITVCTIDYNISLVSRGNGIKEVKPLQEVKVSHVHQGPGGMVTRAGPLGEQRLQLLHHTQTSKL